MVFSISAQPLFYTGDFDDQHMSLIVVTWSIMVFNKQKVNARLRCIQNGRWRKNGDCHCKTIPVAYYVMTCHFKAYAKANNPGRHIVLSVWQMKNVGHRCERSLVVTLSRVVVIHHKIFMTRQIFFWYIANEVKYWWFDISFSLVPVTVTSYAKENCPGTHIW